jgi:hypothetical protein
MAYDDKPKRKNLSPDELLQQAKLLHPENESFLFGESEKIYPYDEIDINLHAANGIGVRKKGEELVNVSKWTYTASAVIVTIGTIAIVLRVFYFVIEAFTNADVLVLKNLFAAGLAAVPLVFVIPFAVIMWRAASRKSPDTQQLVSELISNGEIIVGTNVKSHKFFEKVSR